MLNRPCWWTPLALIAALTLASCGDDDAPSISSTSDVVANEVQPGPTPFIATIPLSGVSLKDVTEFHYVIEAKAGALSAPVDVGYTAAALTRRGHVDPPGQSVTLPVFGLYAGRQNFVNVTLRYTDGSSQSWRLSITTTPYLDPRGIYDHPQVNRALAAPNSLDFSYIYIKSALSGPVVIDTDGEVRWIGPDGMHAYSSAFVDGAFLVGAPDAPTFKRLELDGTSRSGTVAAPSYTAFHHNIDIGKSGRLAEFDTLNADGPNLESVLAEIDTQGVVAAEWDFADILARHMRSLGDDPAAFVRPGIDWFHMNAAVYDARDDSIIVSSRENFVVKVDYRSGNVIWIFGDPSKYWYQFPSLRAKALQLQAGGLYPLGQHSLSITQDGSLLLFNNGAPSFNQPAGAPVGETRSYSAVSAYRFDVGTMTATEAWRFDHGQTVRSDVCSSVSQMPSGSMLISYSAASNRTKLRVVGLDPTRNVIFDLEYRSPTPCVAGWNSEPIRFERLRIQ
jgi:arylsulfate sulfotransferase